MAGRRSGWNAYCEFIYEEVDEVKRAEDRNKSKIQAHVVHVLAMLKRLWGFTMVR